jgi:hypothetical protein
MTKFYIAASRTLVGDCYLVGLSQASNATLVTFDAGLFNLDDKLEQDVLLITSS